MKSTPSDVSRMLWWHALASLPRATWALVLAFWWPLLATLVLGLAAALLVRLGEHPWQETHLVVAPGTALHVAASYASWWGKLENGPGVLLLGAIALSIVGRRRTGQIAVVTVLWGQLVAGVLVNLGKSGLGRARPNRGNADAFIGPTLDYAYQSFPSGHTTAAFALAATLAAFFPRWGWLALPYAVLVGWSRLALHVHHPSDVIMGMVLGTVCGVVCGRAGRVLTAPGATLPLRSRKSSP